MFLYIFTHKTKSKIHKTLNWNSYLIRTANASSILQGTQASKRTELHRYLWWVFAAGRSLLDGRESHTCCLQRFAACWKLRSGHCKKLMQIMTLCCSSIQALKMMPEALKKALSTNCAADYVGGGGQVHGDPRQFFQFFQKSRRCELWGFRF